MRYNSVMSRSVAAVLAVFVFGAAVVAGFGAFADPDAGLALAVAVLFAGVGVWFLPGDLARPAAGGLVVTGAALLGRALGLLEPGYVLLTLGPVTLAVLVLAVLTRGRVWVAGAGFLVPVVIVHLLVEAAVTHADVAVIMLVVAVGGAVATVWLPLAGPLAATAVTFAFGGGLSPVTTPLHVGWMAWSTPGPPEVVVATLALATAAVLVGLAALRRDVVTGLLAAVVLVQPVPAQPALAVPLGIVVVAALVALRVPRLRPGAQGAAAAAVVAVAGLVAIVAIGLPAMGAGPRLTGILAIVVVLVAGALGHFLPAPAGVAAGVVALVGAGIALPLGQLLGAPDALDLLFLVAAVPLLRRHPAPAVFAAAAFLVLRAVPEPATVVVVGLLAAVAAFRWPAGQAVGAVVLGWLVFAPALPGTGTVVLHLVLHVVVVLAIVASAGWRSSAAVVVAGAAAMDATVLLLTASGADIGAVAVALVVSAAALLVAAQFLARRARFTRSSR